MILFATPIYSIAVVIMTVNAISSQLSSAPEIFYPNQSIFLRNNLESSIFKMIGVHIDDAHHNSCKNYQGRYTYPKAISGSVKFLAFDSRNDIHKLGYSYRLISS